jgi:hypothetical protein
MNCPRCGEPLADEGPNRRWLRYFECTQCWLAFEMVAEALVEHQGHPRGRSFLQHAATLQPGRTPRPTGWLR